VSPQTFYESGQKIKWPVRTQATEKEESRQNVKWPVKTQATEKTQATGDK
jgi:hypothetical protein